MLKARHILIALFLINLSFLSAQNPIYMFDEKSGQEIIYGNCSIEHLKTGIFGEYFKLEYPNYIPNPEIIEQINTHLQESNALQIVVIIGTWCGDSKDQVPRFVKIIDELANSKLLISEIICLDSDKTAPQFDNQKYKVERVPTFVIYNENIEIGRIVETPQNTLESDLLQIILKQ